MGTAQIVTDVGRKLDTVSPGRMHAQAGAANEADIGRGGATRPVASGSLRTRIFYLLLLLVVYTGWQYRGNVYITPEEGAGYALGIIGGSMLLLLLMYPLRKHLRWMRSFGQVRHWFRSHMLLGAIAPVCILYHCNYQLGSANGTIALFSMLLVAGSGLVGRYFYMKIHYGLYGKKADLAHLGSDAALARSYMNKAFEVSPEMHSSLQKIEKLAGAPLQGLLSGMVRVFTVGITTHWYWITSGPALRRAIRGSAWCRELTAAQRRLYYRHARYYLRDYLRTVRKVAGLSFYERLFSLWHILHMPLYLMLLISGFVHVYAVHMY